MRVQVPILTWYNVILKVLVEKIVFLSPSCLSMEATVCTVVDCLFRVSVYVYFGNNSYSLFHVLSSFTLGKP